MLPTNRIAGYFVSQQETQEAEENQIADFLVGLREEAKVSRQEVAEASGVPYAVLTNLELGRSRRISHEVASKLSAYYGVVFPEAVTHGATDDRPKVYPLPPLARNLRRLRGYRTQQQVSEATGIPLGSYRNWENGYTDRINSPEAIRTLCNYFSVTAESLFKDTQVTAKPDHAETTDEFEQFLIEQLKIGLKGRYRLMLIDTITLAAKHS